MGRANLAAAEASGIGLYPDDDRRPSSPIASMLAPGTRYPVTWAISRTPRRRPHGSWMATKRSSAVPEPLIVNESLDVGGSTGGLPGHSLTEIIRR
jgi:hypothetical protein